MIGVRKIAHAAYGTATGRSSRKVLAKDPTAVNDWGIMPTEDMHK